MSSYITFVAIGKSRDERSKRFGIRASSNMYRTADLTVVNNNCTCDMEAFETTWMKEWMITLVDRYR